MKQWKTALRFAALGLTAALAFTACGVPAGSTNTGSETTAEGKTQIQYWHINGDSQGGKAVDEFIKEFNESQDKIEVVGRFNSGYDELLKNLQADTAAGRVPDIVQVAWSNLEYFPSNFEYIGPEDLIQKYFPEDSDFLDKTYTPEILNLAKNRQGTLAGVPYSVSNPVLYFNADLLKECGLSEEGPKDWNEFAEFAKAIKEKTGKYGAYLQEGDTWVLSAILESGGAKMLTYEGDKPVVSFASQEGKDAMQSYADLVVKEQAAVHLTNLEDGLKAFNDGEVGMIVCSIAKAEQINSIAKFDVRSTLYPAFPGKDRKVPAGGCYLAVTSQDEAQQKAAWEFIKFLSTDDNAAKWVAGTGYVPATKGAENSPILKDYLVKNTLLEAAMAQRKDAVQWTAWPGTSAPEIQQTLKDMRDQILSGSKEVGEAMDEAQAAAQKAIK